MFKVREAMVVIMLRGLGNPRLEEAITKLSNEKLKGIVSRSLSIGDADLPEKERVSEKDVLGVTGQPTSYVADAQHRWILAHPEMGHVQEVHDERPDLNYTLRIPVVYNGRQDQETVKQIQNLISTEIGQWFPDLAQNLCVVTFREREPYGAIKDVQRFSITPEGGLVPDEEATAESRRTISR